MSIVGWDPLRGMSDLQERINKIFEEAFPKLIESEDKNVTDSFWKPLVDIYETEDEIFIKAELPGVKKENISVEVKNNLMIIQGEREPEIDIGEMNYHNRERRFGKFYRSFRLQEIVFPEKINASLKDGVLEVRVRKLDEETPKHIKISVE